MQGPGRGQQGVRGHFGEFATVQVAVPTAIAYLRQQDIAGVPMQGSQHKHSLAPVGQPKACIHSHPVSTYLSDRVLVTVIYNQLFPGESFLGKFETLKVQD